MEKVVYLQLSTFLNDKCITEIFQSGFKSAHSTETALLRVFNDIFLTSDSGDTVALLLLDLTAAFDTVDHQILLSRLENCVGIKGLALAWIRSYLEGRSFSVQVGDAVSSTAPLSCGVPQGSVLGPLLFSMYLLPLGSILRSHNVSFHFYADDCQIYVPLSRSITLLECLNEVKAWMAMNFLYLNESKTEFVLIAPSDSAAAVPVDVGCLTRHISPVVTNLGVRLDGRLKLDAQIGAVVKTGFFQLRQLAKVKPVLSRHDFEILIHAFITTRLDYCNALYTGISKSNMARLQLVQNAAARLLTGTRKFDHITPILQSLHWLPVHFRTDFKILLFVFKCLHGLAPQYLSNLLVPYTPSRLLRSADQALLVVPKTKRKSRGDRAFAVAAPRLWNELPLHIRLTESLAVFKSRLKTHLFSLAFNSV